MAGQVDKYDNLYNVHGQAQNVDPDLLRAISTVESQNNDDAIGPQTRFGTAKGRMQFIDPTARYYKVTNPHDPNQSIPAAATYMNDLLNYHNGDVGAALNTYSGGAKGYPDKVAQAYSAIKAKSSIQDDTEAFLNGKLGAPLPDKSVTPEAQSSLQKDTEDFLSGKLGAPLPNSVPGELPPKIKGETYMEATPTGPDGQPISPVARSMGKIPDENRVPGVATQAAVSLATDPEQKRRIMAAQLFPGMDPKEALSRVTYENGRMIAIDQNDRPFYVDTPSANLGGGPITAINTNALTPGNIAKTIAGGAGGALPLLGGVAGGVMASPTSLVAGPATAAAGAAAGDAARQWLAGKFDPNPNATPYNIEQTAREALLSGAGQAAGAIGNRLLAPNALLVPQSEIRLAQSGPVLGDAAAAYQRAGAQGVDLSPGQASGLRSLLQYEDFAKNNPAMSDRAVAFYRNQANQLGNAGQNMLGTVSPITDKTDAAMMLQQGANDAINGMRTQANKLAGPQFKAAESVGNVMTPDLAQLAETPAMQDALAKARIIYKNKYGPPPETPDFRLWQETKQVLDDAYGQASKSLDTSGGRSVASGIDSVRQRLIANLDTAYPTYGEARAIAAPGHAAAARLEDSAVGNIAKGAGDEPTSSVLRGMFDPTRQNPRAISQARDAFLSTGRSDEWYAGVRGYIQDAIDRASTSADGLNPSMLRREVWGKEGVRQNIQAALTPEQYKGFENFLKTVEDISATFPQNSLTAQRLNAGNALTGAASNTSTNKLVRGIGAVTSPQTLWQGGRTITDPLDQWITGRNVKSVMDNLFSPNGMTMLEDMAKLPLKSSKAASGALQILSRSAPQLPAANDEQGLSGSLPTNRLMQR